MATGKVNNVFTQPHPQGLLLVQTGGSEKPLAKAAKVAPKICEDLSR